MTDAPLNIRATHHYGFRSGEWAEITGLRWINDRPCFAVRFIDGVTDSWPVYDPSDPYEFRQRTWATTSQSELDRRHGGDSIEAITPVKP